MMRRSNCLAAAVILAGFTAACAPDEAVTQAAPAPTLLIENVTIVDGTGAPARAGDVRITGETIAAIGDLQPRDNEAVHDGEGLALAPGFIDTHSHAGGDLAEQPEALPAVSQGITTVVVGQDGGSFLPLADFFANLEANPVAVNVASYAGHNTLRSQALEDLHPRARGAFTRVLGRYVREDGLLSLEQAVHKMTGLAAQHIGFENRGVIRVGALADLVLFDPETVIDRATPESAELLSDGIRAVWVAGEPVFENGRATGNRPGSVIRRAAP